MNTLEATGRAMERLTALWNIQDILNDENMSKREKLLAISAAVDAALNPDPEFDDDWGYQ
jgi:hypothetical protein